MTTTERIEIYVNPPREQGYGWTVDCSDCIFNEKMLSEDGAKRIAKEHAKYHTPKIVVGL